MAECPHRRVRKRPSRQHSCRDSSASVRRARSGFEHPRRSVKTNSGRSRADPRRTTSSNERRDTRRDRVGRLCEGEAARQGCLSTLKSLHRRVRVTFDEGLCLAAAKGGQLQVLKWLLENDCPWDERACSGAAQFGHLGVLKWSDANDCPWDEKTCTGAAQFGHVEVLQWARANGCPWEKRTRVCAAQGGHVEILQWARANGCP
jgi:hypothetical protein